MDELLKKYLANGLADFAGLHISGTIPVKQEMINEFIAQTLEKAQAGDLPGSATTTTTTVSSANSDGAGEPSVTASKPPKQKLPVKELLKLVDRVEVKANEGVLTLEFEIRR